MICEIVVSGSLPQSNNMKYGPYASNKSAADNLRRRGWKFDSRLKGWKTRDAVGQTMTANILPLWCHRTPHQLPRGF